MTDDPKAHAPAGPDEGDTSTSSPAPLHLPNQASVEAVNGPGRAGLDVDGAKVKRVRAPRRPLRRRGGLNKKGDKRGLHNAAGEKKPKIGGRVAGEDKRSHISPKVKDTRNELMLAAHLTGKTIKEVSEIFGVSHLTASEGITDATRSESFTQARNYMQFRLLPKALRVIDAALDEGNEATARWLVEKTKMEESFGTGNGAGAGGNGGGASDDFETYRLELIRKRRNDTPTDPLRHAEGPSRAPGLVIDATVVATTDSE
jgi:hypothetical protein